MLAPVAPSPAGALLLMAAFFLCERFLSMIGRAGHGH